MGEFLAKSLSNFCCRYLINDNYPFIKQKYSNLCSWCCISSDLPDSKQETSCDQNNILDNIVTVGDYQIFPKSKLEQSGISVAGDKL